MAHQTLLSSASNFFESMGYTVEYDMTYEGFSGLVHKFDLLVRKGKEEHVVLVMDWKRTVGIDVVIKAEKAAEDVDFPHPILIANRFSEHSKAYSNKKRIRLMTGNELLKY